MRKARYSAFAPCVHFPLLALAVITPIIPGVALAQEGGKTQKTPESQAPAEEKVAAEDSQGAPPAAEPESVEKEAVPAEQAVAEPEGEPTATEGSTPEAPADPGSIDGSGQDTTTKPVPNGDLVESPSAAEAVPPPSGGTPQAEASVNSSAGSSNSAFGAFPNPADDQVALEEQGKKRPKDVEPSHVFAEDWWSHTRPTMEIHGNFRVRAEMFHNFSLNRIDSPGSALWPRPADDYYEDLNRVDHGAQVCTPDESKTGESDNPKDANVGCVSPTQAGANMRFRIEPTIVISDNLRVSSQIDMLGNLVMGSTAQGNTNFPAASGRYGVNEGSGYRPISATTNSATSPVSGVNSLQDAVQVRRAWAEYDTPFGQLKFGRMADHWGLGILRNAGDDLDSDYQSTVDRISFTTGLPSKGLYAGGAWDFMDEGPTSAGFTVEGGQPYDLSQRDDLSRMNLMLYRQMDRQLEKLALAKGKVVLNGGLYITYQYQRLANDSSGASATCDNGAAAIDCQAGEASAGYTRRGFKMVTPDLYGELKYKKFHAAFELVTHQGKFDSLATKESAPPNEDLEEGWKVRQWALATEITQRLVEDRLKLGFYFGWASGDNDVNSLIPENSIQEQIGDNKIETFRFHPGYRVDLILNRHLLSRVQGSYYFKPTAEYDFIRKATGMRLGGRAEVIWTRASNFLQSPGHQRDLGIELNGTVYYQSKDGVLNDREDLKGGFYSMLQYGVLFPLSGLGYLEQQTAGSNEDTLKLKAAQTVRGFMGVAF